jgi:hypothetical protein
MYIMWNFIPHNAGLIAAIIFLKEKIRWHGILFNVCIVHH